MPDAGYDHLIVFWTVAIVAWFLVIRSWPRLLLKVYARAIRTRASTVPSRSTRSPPHPWRSSRIPPPARIGHEAGDDGRQSRHALTAGTLDLRLGPQVLQVPDMAGRYYAVPFTAPDNIVFGYVGTRATGTHAGNFLVTGPGWTEAVPNGMTRIASPSHAVLVIGRTLVTGDDDLPAAHALASQIRVVALTPRAPGAAGGVAGS
ncbi:MAG: DUF1254 domain-containing protein [Vicinamibacterales bacterium]